MEGDNKDKESEIPTENVYGEYDNKRMMELAENAKKENAKQDLLKLMNKLDDIEKHYADSSNGADNSNNVSATGGKNKKNKKGAKQNNKPVKPVKPTITGKKEILGKERCIYKKAGDRKEYVKYKRDLITVKDYKKIISVKKTKK
jgi:hypothetical protein